MRVGFHCADTVGKVPGLRGDESRNYTVPTQRRRLDDAQVRLPAVSQAFQSLRRAAQRPIASRWQCGTAGRVLLVRMTQGRWGTAR